MVFVKKNPISVLKEGDSVDDVFVVKVKKGMSEYVKGFSFELILSDSSGKSLNYKYWGSSDEERVRELYNSIGEDSVVHVQGKVSSYRGKLQLATNEPMKIRALKPGEYNAFDFIRPAKSDAEMLYSEIKGAISSVKNSSLRRLLVNIFEDPEIKDKLKKHPGAIEIHHNWLGGLLDHIIEVLRYSLLSCSMFPELDRDVVVAGALLHDIGKLDELAVTSRIKASDHGQLLGHIVLSCVFVSARMDEAGVGEPLKSKVLHVIASHHGMLVFGSPKEPMFPEAVAVHFADQMSSQVSELIEFSKSAREDTDDNFMFHMRKQRNIYLR